MDGDYFVTVRTEGAMLQPEILQSIAVGDNRLGGLSPSCYHLARGERLNEQIKRSWNRLVNAWTVFCNGMDTLEISCQGTSFTLERWLQHLFKELGYGQLIAAPSARVIRGKSYPVSHFWQRTPIHLLGFRIKLDGHTPGVSGAVQANSHSMLQEFLNRSPGVRWGFLSNGLRLRILRDNINPIWPAYIEFDLQAMMDRVIYSDFVLLWLLCHRSRVEAENPQDCWLEKWYNIARGQALQALDQLRDSVAKAIAVLGSGFLAHPANVELRSKLCSGALNKEGYFRQLLRLTYRLIFLFVAEDRELLLLPDAPPISRDRYFEHCSMQRLRILAGKKKASKYPDLYRNVSLIMDGLYKGERALALPALGGFLWAPSFIPDLESSNIGHEHFLQAIRHLAYHVRDGDILPVDYRNLGTEELGSVYESLLELHPQMNLGAEKFYLDVAAGHERKTTGIHCTHPGLIQCLLDSALDPVLDEACNKIDPERALLDLKICDPACGSGHFLIAAAHRVAKRLADVRTCDEEPSLEEQRSALREVISRSIYGVDLREMAVELCKVSLWMEALVPGKPLPFLDNHLQCGNSLLGATPALLAKGIPDAAFKPVAGDDRLLCEELAGQNCLERKHPGQLMLVHLRDWEWAASKRIDSHPVNGIVPDETLEQTHRGKKGCTELQESEKYRHDKLVADAWCAAFVWKKNKELPGAITEYVFRSIQNNPDSIEGWMHDEINRLAEQYRFFHWHLAFPDVFKLCEAEEPVVHDHVGWCGGFDVMLGNPPWERIRVHGKKWFAFSRPDITFAPNAAIRRRRIKRLKRKDPQLFKAFLSDRRAAKGEIHLLYNTGHYPLCRHGDINIYPVFIELKRQLLGPAGRIGCIVPTGIAIDETNRLFLQSLMDAGQLISLYDFENREKLFVAVDSRARFSLMTLCRAEGGNNNRAAEFLFFATNTGHLLENGRKYALTAADMALLNPNTKTCPAFRTRRDAGLVKAIYCRVPAFIKEGEGVENPWGAQISTMFHISNDLLLFRIRNDLEKHGWRLKGNVFEKNSRQYLPLFEAGMFHHFDHRFGSYEAVSEDCTGIDLPKTQPQQYADANFAVLPRYWVHERELLFKIVDAPNIVISAYISRLEMVALEALAHWVAGNKAIQGELSLLLGEVHKNARIMRKRLFGKVSTASLEQKYPLEREDKQIVKEAVTALGCVDQIVKGRRLTWLLTYRDTMDAAAERTVISSAVSAVGVGENAHIIRVKKSLSGALIMSNLSSFVLDYVARSKVSGERPSHSFVKQLPLLTPGCYRNAAPWFTKLNLAEWLLPRIVELTYTSFDLFPFAQEQGYAGPPFCWNEERRFLIRCELDAAYFHLYGIERDDVDYIMETFPIVKSKDEARHDSYLTKETILKIYDQMKLATDAGRPYQTLLDPPPGPPGRWPLDSGGPWPCNIHGVL